LPVVYNRLERLALFAILVFYMLQKGNALLIILILVVIVAAAGYYFYSKGYLGSKLAQAPGATSVFNYGSTPLTTNSSATTAPAQETGNVSSNNISLVVTAPMDGSTLTSPSVTVTGKTSAFADVFVNDQEVTADSNGNFSLKMTLDEGQNGLVITANDANGNVVEKDISVNVQSF
jgi:hypothetical protein